jgi:hypothetical protein
MKLLPISLLAISFTIFSCSGTTKKEAEKQTESVSQEGHHEKGEKKTIKLNDGKKWLVNDEMKPYIQEAQNILKEYEESNSQDYRELSAKLKEANSGLINSCTMDGESHDQLHKWLHPHMQLVDKLEKAQNPEEANKIISKLKRSFETYEQYFQ